MANKAFIIGINTLGLQYCNCDADLMSECLGKYGYEIIKPRSIKSEINTQLDIMVDTCQKTDTTILYFSGHGLVEKDKLFFVLADDATRAGNRININELIETFSDCRANNNLVILDCCNAGIGYADWRPDISDRYLILTASDRLEKSKELDVLKASFLTHILHQTLSTPPFKIVNAENKIYVVALYDWLVEATKQHNSIKNSIQVPIPNLLGNQKANFEVATLITPPSSTPKIDPGEVQLKQKAEQRYRELALESCDIIDLATLPQEDPHIATRELELRRLYVPLHVRVEVTSSDAGDEATFVAIEKRRHLS